MHRLFSASSSGTQSYPPLSYGYDDAGNLRTKGNLTLLYEGGTAGPHGVTSVLDGGPQVGSYAYDANGGMSSYLFTDQEHDAESGLQYFGARYYDPWVGRFVSPDPGLVGASLRGSFTEIPRDPGNASVYTYALNRPTRFVDPDGEQALARLKQIANDAKQTIEGGAAAAITSAGEAINAQFNSADPDGIRPAIIKGAAVAAAAITGGKIAGGGGEKTAGEQATGAESATQAARREPATTPVLRAQREFQETAK